MAAINHNAHIGRKPKLSKRGKLKYNKVYSKRSKHWSISVIKEDKTYDYWPHLATKILQNRIDDKQTILRRVVIAPSTAMAPVLKTSDLVNKAFTRFSKEQNVQAGTSSSQDDISAS